ncbi:MAG: phage holin family protein [Cryobacterium sp.]|nr:phage holin family protein [Cryobacterium sp.]
MRRFIIRVLISSLALWLTTLIVPGVSVTPYEPGGQLELVLTFLLVGLVFGLVNGIIGNAIRIVAFPIYVLTLGLIAIVVNALLLMLVAWLTNLFGFGLHIDSFLWAGVLGAIVLGLLNWAIGLVLRPIVGKR